MQCASPSISDRSSFSLPCSPAAQSRFTLPSASAHQSRGFPLHLSSGPDAFLSPLLWLKRHPRDYSHYPQAPSSGWAVSPVLGKTLPPVQL
eukprot:7700852-Heterocapsa_arctica.AAC.1